MSLRHPGDETPLVGSPGMVDTTLPDPDTLSVFQTDEELGTFWSWIEQARANEEAYRATLRELSSTQLVRLVWTFKEVEDRLFDVLEDLEFEPLLGEDESVSEDRIEDFCGWMVVQGRSQVEQWLADPESLEAKEDFTKEMGIDARYMAEEEYRERHGDGPPTY